MRGLLCVLRERPWAGERGRGRLCKLGPLIGWDPRRPRCGGEPPAAGPAGRQSGHWLPSAASGSTPLPLTQARAPLLPPPAPQASPPPPCRPSPPPPLLPSSSAPRFVAVVSRVGRGGGWSWRFLSTRPGLGLAPGEVGRTRAGVRSPPCPPEPLSTIPFSDSFPTSPPPLVSSPSPCGHCLDPLLRGGGSKERPSPVPGPFGASLCHHLSQPVLPALCPRASALPPLAAP